MPRSARFRLYALGAMCALPYVAMLLFWGFHNDKPRSVLALLVTAALGPLLLAGVTRTWRRFFLVYFPLLIPTIAYAVYSLGFGVVPGHTLGMVLVSATWEELRGLLGLGQAKWILLPLIVFLALYLYLAWRLPDSPIFSGKTYLAARALLVLSVPATVYAASNTLQLVDGIALNPLVGSLMFFAGQLPRSVAEIHGAAVEKIPYHARRTESSGEEVHILIVGESARRGSWSVYGYQRPTTPYLERIKGETFLLKNAWADANLTSLAVPMILTGMAPLELKHKAKYRGNLLDVVKEAGYSTTWLVNQDIDVSTTLGITADHFESPPDPDPGPFSRHLPDGTLLPAFHREIDRAGAPRFIGMHITESHWEYYRRYPPSFQRFGTAKRLNVGSVFFDPGTALEGDLTDAYDNSVLYGDWFLEQVIEAARALKVPATVSFVPDHGESLPAFDAGVSGHGGPIYSAAQFQIPAFVWVNEAYRAAHPRQVAALGSNAAKEIRSHDFFYTVADLMGITFPEAKPDQSFASAQFVPDSTGLIIAGTRIGLRPDS